MNILNNLYDMARLSVAMLLLCMFLHGCDVAKRGPLYPTVEAADQASDLFQDLCQSGEWPTEAASFIDYVQNLEEVEVAQLSDNPEYFTVLYRSGVLHVFYCEPEDERSEESGAAVNTYSTGSNPRIFSGFPNQQSPAATAAVYPSSGADIRSSVQQILRAFGAAGYTEAGLQEPTLEWFRSWNQYGLIYLSGHGGVDTYPDSDGHPEAGEQFEYIYTSTPYVESGVTGNPYESDLSTDARRLVYSTTSRYRTFAVTSRFFRYHYQAGNPENPAAAALPNSIIYLDACHTLDNTTDPNRTAATLVSCGAQMILGWENLVPRRYGAETAAYFFDRLCGLSQVEADDLHPPTRPFTAQQIYTHLYDEGRTSQPGGSRLVYYPTTGTAVTARPVISTGYYLWPDARAGVTNPSISLSGYFGPDRGELLFNNQPLAQILLWDEDRIVAYLPNDNTTGDIKVRANNLESNPLRLWGFSGSITCQVNEAGKYSGEISANFEGRVPLQLMRSEVDGDPETATGPLLICPFFAERGQLEWNISGTWTDDDHNQHELQAQGNAPVVPGHLASSPLPGLECMITFELDPNVANATYMLILGSVVTGTDTVTSPEGAVRQEPWIGVFTVPLSGTNSLPSNWVIPAGSHTGENFQFNWTEIRPDITPIVPTDPHAYPG